MAMSWTNSVEVIVTVDKAGPSTTSHSVKGSTHSEPKRKGFHPLRAVRRIFRRKPKHSPKHDIIDENSARMESLKSRSTSELLGADDERNRPNNGSSHLGSGLSMSHDSVFSPEHNGDEAICNAAQSIQNLAMQELMDRLHPHDSDEDDAGLPHSPCTSPTTAEVLRQGLRETSGKSRSTCSDGSLLSMGSSENDEDSLMQSSRPKMSTERNDGDSEDGAAFPLSHKAAHHKISVRPKRTHAVGRHRKLQQQLTVASLPATPEDIEEIRIASPDRSWHSVGEREAAGSSGSISRASSVMSTSDSTGSLSASASPTRKRVMPTSQELLETTARTRSAACWDPKMKQDDSLGRRRTFSESPNRDQEARDAAAGDGDSRRDKVQSMSVVEAREVQSSMMYWQQEAVKEGMKSASPPPKDGGLGVRQGSPVRRERVQSTQPSLENTSKDHKSTMLVNSELNEFYSPAQEVSIQSGLPVRHSDLRSEPLPHPSTFPQDVGKAVANDATEDVPRMIRASVQRDPSYRVAVQESPNWNGFNSTPVLPEKPKKEESSGGLFGFGSRAKKSSEVNTPREKSKEKKEGKGKKEEKERKEEKEKDDSPFFSRLWGSRRSNKKKKDAKEEELHQDSDSSCGFQNQETDLAGQLKRQSDFPSSSTVDVKAMVQNITARSTFHGTASFRQKEFESQDGKPARPLKPKPVTSGVNQSAQFNPESGQYSKSMESLTGPRSLDSVVPVELDPPPRGHLSGSMPRLDSSPLKIRATQVPDSDVASSAGIMVIEGEVVRLRKKAFGGDETKSAVIPEQPNLPPTGEQKRSSKRSSILSWYNSKKESPPPVPAEKAAKQPVTPVPAPSIQSRVSGKLWSSKKEERKTVEGLSQTTGKNMSPTLKHPILKPPEKKLRSSSVEMSTPSRVEDQQPKLESIQKTPEISLIGSKKQSNFSQDNKSAKMQKSVPTPPKTRTPSPEKIPKTEYVRVSVNRVDATVAKSSQLETSTPIKRRSSSGRSEGRPTPTSVEKYVSQGPVEAKNPVTTGDKVVKRDYETGTKTTTADAVTSQIVDLEASPRANIRKANISKVTKTESPEKQERSQSAETPSKFTRGSVCSGGAEGESELFKVFHRRSLKVKDKDSSQSPAQNQSDAVKTEPKNEKQEVEAKPVLVKEQVVVVTPAAAAAAAAAATAITTTTTTATPAASPPTKLKLQSVPNEMSSSYQLDKPARPGMAGKKSKSLCSEPLPTVARVRTTSSPGTSTANNIEIVSKNGEKMEGGGMPEWRRLAQQRREQREQREKQHVNGNGPNDSSLILQATPKHGSRSKVLDMVSSFQKLQVS